MFHSFNLPLSKNLPLLMLSIFKLITFPHAFSNNQENKMNVQVLLNTAQLLFQQQLYFVLVIYVFIS